MISVTLYTLILVLVNLILELFRTLVIPCHVCEVYNYFVDIGWWPKPNISFVIVIC